MINSANIVIGTASITALALWLSFIILYLWYGNRFRQVAGRIIFIVGTAYASLLIPEILRHPFGITTGSDAAFAWFQVLSVAFGGLGTLALTWLLVRANGRWPWQRKGKDRP